MEAKGNIQYSSSLSSLPTKQLGAMHSGLKETPNKNLTKKNSSLKQVIVRLKSLDVKSKILSDIATKIVILNYILV